MFSNYILNVFMGHFSLTAGKDTIQLHEVSAIIIVLSEFNHEIIIISSGYLLCTVRKVSAAPVVN